MGIDDDVAHTSLTVDRSFVIESENVFRAVFFGLGSDGTVGANKNSIKIIGELEGLSTRYVQKLFKGGSTTFGEYLKERRLERCRIDLANPALAHFTIAELCFRSGFGDAANFSRAFTARFGVSRTPVREALHVHNAVMRECIREHRGYERQNQT